MGGRVENKIVLLTGGAMGLGRAATERLVEEGATVVMTDYDHDAGRKTAEEIGEKVRFVEQDVTDPDRWPQVIDLVEDEFGRLDVLVNNAAITVFGSIEVVSYEDFRRCFQADVDSVFLGCKAALPLMSKTGGSIINFSSAAGLRASADLAAYNAAKAAVRMLTQSIALHCARERKKVRVNSVHPGTILTPNVMKVAESTPDPEATLAGFREKQPLGHLGEPEDIAELVVYLASDESKFATGAAFTVDGGLSV
ncbi:MAG: glucose 1-dehydrogenase [Pseudomonadota bacterium]